MLRSSFAALGRSPTAQSRAFRSRHAAVASLHRSAATHDGRNLDTPRAVAARSTALARHTALLPSSGLPRHGASAHPTPLRASLRHASSTAAVEASDPEAARVEEEAKSETDNDPFRKLGYLYFDSAFPIRLGFWDLRYLLARLEKRSTLDRIKASLPPSEQVGHGFKVIGVDAREKDGGAFLTFSYRDDATDPSGPSTIDVIERNLQDGVKKVFNPLMFFIGKPGVHVVRGKPFREDMNIFPANRLFVKLEGGDANEEQLWELLRPYGRILSISKEKPSEALITFSRMRGATAARNCAHSLVLSNGARLVVTYKGFMRFRQFWEWVSNHPRIVFPVAAFLLGGLTYVIFDPIRQFTVESKIRNTFSLDDYRIYTWLKDNTVRLFHDDDKPASSEDDWWERREAASNIQEWIREKPSTFITITGPRGSGKAKLLDRAISKDVQHLVIDCEAMARTAKNDTMLVSSLASETGYWPVFGWLNGLNNIIDLASVGLIGSKAGFATPVDAQLKQVLGVVGSALNHLNEETQRKLEKARKRQEKAEKQAASQIKPEVPAEKAALLAGDSGQALEDANQRGSAEQIVGGEEPSSLKEKRQKSFDVPVVVIKSFHHKGLKQAVIHTVLAEWAAEMVTNGVAHVIFVSDNPVSMGKELAKSLPNVPFQSITLADADEAKARSYVFNKLKGLGRLPVAPEASLAMSGGAKPLSLLGRSGTSSDPAGEPAAAPEPTELDRDTAAWIDKLGGRLTDLENLVQKVSIGQSVEAAVEDIIATAASTLRKNAFGEDSTESKNLPWKGSQAWKLIKTLADKEEVNYYGLLYDSFKGDEAALKALEGAEIISVRHFNGRPSTIRAGRPVLREAMKRMVKDDVFRDTQTLLANTSSIESAEKQIRALEEEIRDISTMIQGSPFKVSIGGGNTGAVVDEDPAHPPPAAGAAGSSMFGSGLFGGSSSRSPLHGHPAPIVVAPISAADAARARTEFLMSKMAALQSTISKLDAENARIQVRLVRYREESG